MIQTGASTSRSWAPQDPCIGKKLTNYATEFSPIESIHHEIIVTGSVSIKIDHLVDLKNYTPTPTAGKPEVRMPQLSLFVQTLHLRNFKNELSMSSSIFNRRAG